MPPTVPGAAGADPENSALARLAAALHPSDPHPDRVSAAGENVALEAVRVAKEHRVSALLSRTLDRAGRLESLPENVRVALRRDVLEQAGARAQLDEVASGAAAALIPRGIPFLFLKGAALGTLTYGDPALRAMTDVDLLVRATDLDRSLEALVASGFRGPSATERAFWEDSYYNLPVGAPDGRGSVEIHWSIAQPGRQRPDIDGLFARRRDFTQHGLAVAALGPADLFLHQALHLSYHYFEPRLVWIHDLALLHRADPPVDEIVSRARRWSMAVPLALSVLHVEKVYPGVTHPRLLEYARGVARARVIALALRSSQPVQFLRGWNRRAVQLALAVLMIDNPLAALRRTASWARRTVHHGDVAGRRRPKPDGP